jgi:hypothetical protein
MRMINELVVKGEPSEIARLVGRLEAVPQNGWKRETEIEERLKGMGSAPWGALCFSSPGTPDRPPATLFLHKRGSSELSVANIFPKGRTALSDEEYNKILSEFDREILRPSSGDMGVQTLVIRPLARLEASLSSEALRRLKAFSTSANRPSPHPSDWRRWDQFLVQIHQDGSFLDEFDLAMWFADQGWAEPQFAPFLERFRTGKSLLSAYDEERSAR